MDIEFPNIRNNQFALLIEESNTGVVLNSNLEYCFRDDGHYLIFDSIDIAKKFISEKRKLNVNFLLFDKNKNIVFEKYSDPEIKENTKPVKWWQFWKN